MSDAAIAVIVAGVLQFMAGVGTLIALWLKLAYGVESATKEISAKADAISRKTDSVTVKLEENTTITRETGVVTAANAKAAAVNANSAKVAAEGINQKLNGGVVHAVDDAVAKAVAPLNQALAEHAAADERNVKEIEAKIEALNEYVHDRNHKMDGVLQAINNKLDLIMRRQSPPPPNQT